MDEKKFIKKCKEMIKDFYSTIEKEEIQDEDIYVVWLCKILQNNKCLISTTISDTRYFEITYNGDCDKFYFDAYVKEYNKTYGCVN